MIIPPIRKSDRWGYGHYRASRGDRVHEGVDLLCEPDSPFFSDVNGVVTRWGYPYRNNLDYRLIHIRVDAQTTIKYMYLSPLPSVKPGDPVHVGQHIGTVQDIAKRYEGMLNHVHFEVWIEGYHVDPIVWLLNYRGV